MKPKPTKTKPRTVNRSAGSGKFVTDQSAREKPGETVRETVGIEGPKVKIIGKHAKGCPTQDLLRPAKVKLWHCGANDDRVRFECVSCGNDIAIIKQPDLSRYVTAAAKPKGN